MRRTFGSAAALAALALALGCGKKDTPSVPAVALSENTGAPSAPGSPIEGAWTLVETERQGRKFAPSAKITDAEKKIRATAGQLIATEGGKEDPLNYKLDPSKSPPEIDLTPPDGLGATMYGIYKLEGDRLTICAVLSHTPASRPKQFKTTKEDGALMMTLKKD